MSFFLSILSILTLCPRLIALLQSCALAHCDCLKESLRLKSNLGFLFNEFLTLDNGHGNILIYPEWFYMARRIILWSGSIYTKKIQYGVQSFHRIHYTCKHHKNCECCPVSLLIVRWQRLSWIQVLHCRNCNQCLKCHESLGLSLSLCQKIQK